MGHVWRCASLLDPDVRECADCRAGLRVQLLIWVVVTISTGTAAWFFVPPEGVLGAAQEFAFGVGMGGVAAAGAVAIVLLGTL